MKNLLPLLLLACAGCSQQAAPANNDEQAVRAYLQKNLDDPASYEPGTFSKPSRFTPKDSAGWEFVKNGGGPTTARTQDAATAIGRKYRHEYRAKNKAGGLESTWQYFAVYNNGAVASYNPQSYTFPASVN